MTPMNAVMPEDGSASGREQFMLTELQLIETETQRLRTEGISRVNYYTTLVTSVVAALFVLGELDGISDAAFRLAAILALAFVALLGVTIVEYLVGRDIATDLNARATGRLRRYFIDHCGVPADYLTWQHGDAPTKWVTKPRSGLRRNVILLASAAGGLAGYLGAVHVGVPDNSAAVIGLLVAAGLLAVLYSYSRVRLARAADRASEQVRFSHHEPV